MKSSREWATFLRIPPPNTSNLVPALDPGWCAARGVNTGAEVVLRLLRDYVVPAIRHYEQRGLVGYHFLVHDRQSGVPTTEEDHSAYIHLRLSFKKSVTLHEREGFVMTQPVSTKGQTSIGGLDMAMIKHGLPSAEILINMQSAWVLALVAAHTWDDDANMVRQVLQFGHFFANMTQMHFR